MEAFKNLQLPGPNGRPILLDIFYKSTHSPKKLVVFAHGFKGFKDWGHFPLIARGFAERGFVFLKFNFSHNGTTPADPLDFVDLEAFGSNNFSLELEDLDRVIEFTRSPQFPVPEKEYAIDQLHLLGHSRGGGIVILKAAEDQRVCTVAAWASVNSFGGYWPDEHLEEWQKSGVIYAPNARTGQQMPLYWQLYENFLKHHKRLDIPAAVQRLKIPFLIVHGTADTTVPVSAAHEMKRWQPDARLLALRGGDHTFGGRHPWESAEMPAFTQKALAETASFFDGKP